MVFGLFGSNQKLEAQKAALEACTRSLEDLERRAAGLDTLKAEFANVWPDEDDLDLHVARLATLRELVDLMHQRAANARSELANFDDAIAQLQKSLPGLNESWTAFVAILLARQKVADQDPGDLAEARQLPILECQRVLHTNAEELYKALRTHVDELHAIKPRHQGPWPAKLDLDKIEIGMADARQALDIYRERLATADAELPQASTATMMDIIAMFQNSIAVIEDERAQLAIHTATKFALEKSGFGRAKR